MAGGQPKPNPILCGRNSEDRWIFGYTLQAKGANEHGAKMLEEEIRRLGSGRIVIRSDQEPSILALRDKACDSCMVAIPGLLILREVSSVGQSQANGLAEGAVREVKAKFRSMRFCAEERLGGEIPSVVMLTVRPHTRYVVAGLGNELYVILLSASCGYPAVSVTARTLPITAWRQPRRG